MTQDNSRQNHFCIVGKATLTAAKVLEQEGMRKEDSDARKVIFLKQRCPSTREREYNQRLR